MDKFKRTVLAVLVVLTLGLSSCKGVDMVDSLSKTGEAIGDAADTLNDVSDKADSLFGK